MQKRQWIVGVAMGVTSLVCGAVASAGTSPARHQVHAAVDAEESVPVIVEAPASAALHSPLSWSSDTTMMFATGVALIGVAAGVRRRTCS